MGSVEITLIAWACMFFGVQIGNVIRRYSPEYHRNGDSKDAIRAGSAVIGTLAALVLGLMVSSASKNFLITHEIQPALAGDTALEGFVPRPTRGAGSWRRDRISG